MKKTTIISAISAFCFFANAQTTDRNITIERDYTPVIQDAGKVLSTPEVLEKVEPKEEVVYSDFNFPLPISQNIQTLSAAEANTAPVIYDKDTYLRVGFGNYFNNLLDFFMPIIKNSDNNLNVGVNHLATFGKKIHSDSKIKLNFDHNFDNLTLFAGTGGGYEYFNYYGYEYLNGNIDNTNLYTYGNSLVCFNAFTGIHSKPDAENWRYSGQLKFNVLQTGDGSAEQSFSVPISLDFIYKNHRAGIDFSFNYLRYSVYNNNFPDSYSPNIINPYYQYESEELKARLGAILGISIGNSNFGELLTLAPDVYAEWVPFKKWLAFYGGAGGGLNINTLDKTCRENRYSLTLRLEDTYTPFDTYIGFKLKPVSNVLFDAFANYRYIENQYFFVNEEENTSEGIRTVNIFTAEYSSASLLKFGARLAMNFSETVDVQAKFAYNKWYLHKDGYSGHFVKAEQPWHKPTFEADCTANVKITKDITASANVFYMGGRKAKLNGLPTPMKDVIDINLGGTYKFSNWLSFFIKGNNLLNSKYDEYYGYQVQGINFLAGATLAF